MPGPGSGSRTGPRIMQAFGSVVAPGTATQSHECPTGTIPLDQYAHEVV